MSKAFELKAETKAAYEAQIKELKDLNQLKDEKISLLKEQIATLGAKVEQVKAKEEPESGPGPDCEAFKLSMAEAVRDESGALVRDEKGNLKSACKSKYTKEYTYKGKKLIGMEEHPELKAFLCAHHAEVFLGVKQ